VSTETPRALAARLDAPFYRFSRLLALAVKGVFTRARVEGIEYMPREGGVLVVSNHLSNADPVVLMAVSPRSMTFMAKEELWQHTFSRLVVESWQAAFPVRRGQTDIRAVRNALQLLHAGLPVVVFAEGTRRPNGLGQPLPGIGYLASRANCPVLPVAINGTQHMGNLWSVLRFPSFSVRFGPTFSVDSHGQSATEIADDIMWHIAALLPPDRRGAYADVQSRANVGVG
jgi:1-acyl-sn-glycerol-3-phosphate acyltransferase